MTAREELIQDLRAHAHEASAQCAALMRSAATELEKFERGSMINGQGIAPERRVKGASCS